MEAPLAELEGGKLAGPVNIPVNIQSTTAPVEFREMPSPIGIPINKTVISNAPYD